MTNSFSQKKSFNTSLLSTISFGSENSNDIWGYVDDQGLQYAVIGNARNTRVYSLEDPTNPRLRYTAPGAQSVWRDIKSYNKHLYVTTDQGTDGLVIIDMTKAPDTISHIFYQPQLTVGTQTKNLERCHNLYIDEKGFAYLSGCNISNRGVLIFDLKQDPNAPVYTGAADINYSHDNFARGDTLYSSEINVGQLGIYDISDRSNPVLLASRTTSRTFTHNAWPSNDSKFVFTTDERPNAFVDAYDISDLNNIKLLDKFRPLEREGDGVIPHNTHYFNGYIVTSWYTDGVRIVDAHKPDNLIEVAFYDTWEDPASCHNGFSGCWGAFPFTTNNLLYASDINNGLYILNVDYKRAAYLEGKVTNQFGNAVEGARIFIHSDQVNREFSSASGDYKTGHAFYGEYLVEVTHAEYAPFTAMVNFEAGVVTNLDIVLEKSRLVDATISVKDINNKPVTAKITLINTGNNINIDVDESGQKQTNLPSGSYDLTITSWGYLPYVEKNVSFTQDQTFEYQLSPGYMETFDTDLGWEINASSSNMRGVFERAKPRGTFYLDNEAANPGNDDPLDLGDFAMVTENGLPGAACADVDNGITTLISPVIDLSSYQNPLLSFSYWFFTAGGNTAFDDTLSVYLTNGEDEIEILKYANNTPTWERMADIELSKLIVLTEEMRLIVEIGDDQQSGHIVEGGFDNFSIVEGTSSVNDAGNGQSLVLYPNPAMDKIWIKNLNPNTNSIGIINTLGQISVCNIQSGGIIDISTLTEGLYYVQAENMKGKFIKVSK